MTSGLAMRTGTGNAGAKASSLSLRASRARMGGSHEGSSGPANAAPGHTVAGARA